MKALKTITCVLTFALLLILAPTQAKAVSNNVSATEGTFTVHQFIDGNEVGSLTIRAKGFDKTQTTSCRFGNIQWDVYTSSGTCKGGSAVAGLNYTYKGSSDSSRYPVVGCHVGLTKPLGVVFEKATVNGNGGSGAITVMKDGPAPSGQTLDAATELNSAQNENWNYIDAQSVWFGVRMNYVEYMMDHHADINVYFRTPHATVTYTKGDANASGADVQKVYDFSGLFPVPSEIGMSKTIKASFDGNTQNVDAPFNVWEIPGFLFIQTQGSNLAFNAGVGEMLQFLNMQSCFDHYGLDFKTNPSLTCKAHWYPANVTVPKAPTAEKYTVTIANENATIDTAIKAKSFNGWNVNGSLYQPGEVVAADADFSAASTWSNPTYTVPKAPKAPTYKVTVTSDNAQLNQLTLEKTFSCWKDSDGNSFKPGDVITLTKDTTLTATWSDPTYVAPAAPKAPSYKVTVTSDDTQLNQLTLEKTFSCWKDAAGRNYKAGDSITLTKDMTLTADWKNPTLDITSLAVPTKENYTFQGWKINEELLNETTTKKEVLKSYEITKDTTITAEWKQIPPSVTNDLSKIIDLINKSTLSEEEKAALITRLTSNSLTDADKTYIEKLLESNTTLTKTDKEEIIQAIKEVNASGLTEDQQKAILEALNSGSSAIFKYGNVSYKITKNPDGTISVSISDLNGVTDVVIPNEIYLNGKAYPITSIGDSAFKNNKTIRTVTIPGNVTTIGNSAFEGCSNLTKVSLAPKGLVTIGNKAFKDCVNLTSFTCPSTLQSIGVSAFENCTKLAAIKFNDGLLVVKKRAFFNAGLKNVTLPKTLLKIEMSAFEKCKKMTRVVFASDIKMATVGYRIFANDSALKKIELPKNLRSVPKYMFYHCTSLTQVSGGERVTSIGTSAFEGCKKLPKITLRTKVQKIAKKAFFNCSKLKRVNIKSSALTKIEGKAFKKCHKKIKFDVPRKKIKAYKKLLKGKF